MAQLIEITKNGVKSYKEIQKENTLNYLKKIESEGMNIYKPEELKEILLKIGYKIQESDSNKYYNTYNEGFSYLAKSCYIIEIKTKQSFAHFEQKFTNFENQQKLQEIRKNSVAFDGLYIWDI